ncbi:MAG: TRAP transporter small permease subunit [Gammaproteobacteria bacterium]
MILNIINKLEEGVISLLLVLMTLLVFSEVVMRFGFGTGSLWIQELTLHMSAWFVLFGASYGIKVGAHIGVDAVVRLLPGTAQRVVGVIAILLSLLYCGLFLFGSWEYLFKMYKIGIGMEDLPVPPFIVHLFSDEFAWEVLRIDSEDPKVPLWFAHGMLLVGLTMVAIRLVMLMWAVIVGKAQGFQFADEAKESLHLAEDEQAGEARP